MPESLSTLHHRLEMGAKQIGLSVSRETLDALVTYIQELKKWNKVYNLTALKRLDDIVVQHIFDCMAIIPAISEMVGDDPRIVDVGSGAGLPGIVLALWFPKGKVVCVDSVDKKMTFVRHVAGRMNLHNLEAIHARIEDLPSQEADVVISRAFASLSDFAKLSGQHCKRTGLLVAMKSVAANDDIAELESSSQDWTVKNVVPLRVPDIDAVRNLVVLQRNEKE